MKKYFNKVTIISIIIVLLVLFLSIGWASFNTSLQIDSMSLVRITSDIRITGFNYVTGSNNALAGGEEYSVNKVFGNFSLPEASSTIKYQVEITNMELASNVHMGINSILGLPDNLEIKAIDGYNLKEKICDDDNHSDCGTGAQKNFYITIGYKNNGYDSSNTSYDFMMTFDFKKVHDITYSGFDNPPSSPTSVIDGETATITFTDSLENLKVISGGDTLILGEDYTLNNQVLTFLSPIHDNVYILNPTTYTITYVLNGGVQADNQINTYSPSTNEKILSPTKEGFVFGGWYLDSDFTSNIINNTSQLIGNVTLYADWGNGIAKIGNTYYSTLQEAIEAVETNNIEVTIDLLANTSEALIIEEKQNIRFNLQDYTISNNGYNNVIYNSGQLTITNGKITTTAAQGAINNYGTLSISGGSVISTGARQAIYNDGGTLYISGDAYLSSTATERAAVHNLNKGKTYVTGGTIISTRFKGLYNQHNAGTITIGTQDGNPNKDSLLIQGGTVGVDSINDFAFYDGTIKGVNSAFADETKVTLVEEGYGIAHKSEKINNVNYKVAYLAITHTVTFDGNGGTPSEEIRKVETGMPIETLPTATLEGFTFNGWYTEDDGGTKISSSQIITSDVTYYAHWKNNIVARINNVDYNSLQSAINAVSTDNTETTIELLDDTIGSFTISKNQNIVFNLHDYTISNSGTNQVFINNGKMKIINGTIEMDSTNAAIDNNASGTLIVTGGRIISTGGRGSIYNRGRVEISEDAYLESVANGVVLEIERGTLHNASGGVAIVTGGTIINTQGAGIANAGTLTLGVNNDGTISNSIPNIRGATYGVVNQKTFNFYDGIIKGVTDSLSGTITKIDTNGTRVDGEETIEGVVYKTTIIE